MVSIASWRPAGSQAGALAAAAARGDQGRPPPPHGPAGGERAEPVGDEFFLELAAAVAEGGAGAGQHGGAIGARPTAEQGLRQQAAHGVADNDRPVETLVRYLSLDVRREHVEIHAVDRFARAVTEHIERDGPETCGREARQLRRPDTRGAADAVEEYDGGRRGICGCAVHAGTVAEAAARLKQRDELRHGEPPLADDR